MTTDRRRLIERRAALLQMLAATHVVLEAVGPTATAHGLTLGEAHLLALFETDGRLPLRLLQRASGNKASTLSSMVDRLERKGLASRERSESDRRAVIVCLTDQGQTVAAAARAAFEREASRLAEAGVDLRGLASTTAAILES